MAQNGFLSFIDRNVKKERRPWYILQFSTLGFIGKLFKTESLFLLKEYVLVFYQAKPCDWLLEEFLATAICNHEDSPKECLKEKLKIKVHKS